MRTLAATLVLHAAAAKQKTWCGAQGLDDFKTGLDRDLLEGWGVLLLGPGGTTIPEVAALMEMMRTRLGTVVVSAAERAPHLDELCSKPGAHCFVGQVPLAPHKAAALVAIDGWDFVKESGNAYARRLRELMLPEGRLLIATTENATSTLNPESWSNCLYDAGFPYVFFARDGCNDAIAATVPGKGPLLRADPTVEIVDDVLTPSCDVVEGRILRTRLHERDARASLYEGGYFGKDHFIRAVRHGPWWDASQEVVDRAWLGLEGVQDDGAPYAIIPKYFATFNEHVARLIPETAKRILDVGCGAGLFLKKLKGERPQLIVDGVEPDPVAALAAREHLDSITQGTAEAVAGSLPDAAYDAIILSDVLEHAVHPDILMRLLAPKLSRGGVLCISLPNARFWPEFVRPLLTGEWDYAPHGVLDRTHLRWFTHVSFMKLAAAAGFVEAAPLLRMHYGEDQKAPRVFLEALAADAGADAANDLYAESDVRQYLITLKRRDEPPLPEPYDPAILEARLAEIREWQTNKRWTGETKSGTSEWTSPDRAKRVGL